MASTVMLSIPGYPNYALDTEGNVWSLSFRSGKVENKPRLKRIAIRRRGGKNGKRYLAVTLHQNGKRTSLGLHQVMALAYCGPRPSRKHGALHRDDNPLNNSPSNIYWGTAKRNAEDCRRNGNLVHMNGEKHGLHKLTEKEVLEIREKAKTGLFHREIAAEYGVGREAVGMIVRRKRWAHI